MKKVNLIVGILIGILILSCSNDDNKILDCEIPLNTILTDITSNSVLVNWTENDNQIDVEIEYGISGFVIGSGAKINGNGNSHLLENLSSETNYDIYLKTICDNQESDVSNVINFTTLCNNIYPGDLILSTQEEIDNFSDCFTRIGGSLRIGTENPSMSSDITSLAPLANITDIDGFLHIIGNHELPTLTGLQNITTIATGPTEDGIQPPDLIISGNDSLTNIDLLVSLVRIGNSGNIEIRGNDNLISLFGLNTLFENQSDSINIIITNNDNLTDLNFQSITSFMFIFIEDNSSLQRLDSFENITSTPAAILVLRGNDMLNNFCGLQNLLGTGFNSVTISENLFNPSLQDIIDGNCSQ